MNPNQPPLLRSGVQGDPDARFDHLLGEVLHEVANPALSATFVIRLQQALESEPEKQVNERGSSMQMNSALTLNQASSSSILWTGQQPGSGWNLRGLFGAALLHALAILLIGLMIARQVHLLAPSEPLWITLVEPPPPPSKVAPEAVRLGGGGGQKGPTPVAQGNPPKFAPRQLNPPKAPPLEQPKISIPVTVNVQQDLKMAHSEVPQIGMPNSPLVGMSMGNGKGTGLGSGNGDGIGRGSGGNTGGGVERIGGSVSAPQVLYQPEPEFSEEARKAKVAGNVIVYLQVDEAGKPTHVHVVRGIGMGLDEKAVEAVRQYKFKPAMKDGRPVTVEMNVEVGFQIF